MLGTLNYRAPPNDPITNPNRRTNQATRRTNNNNNMMMNPMQQQQQQQQQHVPAAYVTPPMYKPPLAPVAVPGLTQAQQQLQYQPPVASAAVSKLDQWRRDRAQKLAGNTVSAAALAPQPIQPLPLPPLPNEPSLVLPPAALAQPQLQPQPQQPQQPQQPVAPLVDLTKLREEMISLVQTQAPKLDLDLKLLPFNQRLQDFELRLNGVKNQLQDINASLKAIQLQSNQDRRLILNGITADDFKGLHEDLSAALQDYFVDFEDTVHMLLQEFNDRIYTVYAVTTTEVPQLKGPSFLEQDPDRPKIPAQTPVKICYPQQQTAEGIFIRHLAVDANTGELTINWIPIMAANVTYLTQFHV